MQEVSQSQDGVGENLEESSFFHTLKAFQDYCKTAKYGPQVWKNLDPETKSIIRVMIRMEYLNIDPALWQDILKAHDERKSNGSTR